MTIGRSLVVLAVVSSAAIVTVAAQGPIQTPPVPVFRGGVDSVSVDVVVTDSKNHPISDLTAADFEISEHGRAQKISEFKYISIPVAHRMIDLKQPPAPAPDVATNVLPSPNSRLFVMVVDDLHLIESEILPVQRVMTEFLSSLSPDDEVGMVFVGHSDLSRNITRDPGQLVEAIKNVRAAFGFGLGTGMTPPGALPDRSTEPYARSVAWELKNVAASLAHSGHVRRAIVFVTGGTSLDPAAPAVSRERAVVRGYQLDLNDAFEAAKRADVPIYTLDPRGIPTPETAVRGWGAQSSTVRAQTQHRIVVQQDHIAEIAANTGGRFFINQSNLAEAVDEIVGENGSFYLLGYAPDPYVRDGQFHDIAVKVARPGVSVRARKGYVAAASDTATATAASTLDPAMGTGSNVATLGLRVWAAPIAASPKGMTTAVTMEVTYPTPRDGSAGVDDTLQTSVLAIGPDGEVRATSSRPWHLTGTASRDGSVVFSINDVLVVPSKPSTLRVGVASQMLKQAGTVQMPLDVPNPNDAKLQVSGVALGLASPPKEGALGRNALEGLLPFQPTTTRTFASTDGLRVFATAFWGGKDVAATATLTMTGPTASAPIRLSLSSTPVVNGHHQTTIEATLSLGGLSAGDYVLNVSVQLPGGQPAHRDVPLAIK